MTDLTDFLNVVASAEDWTAAGADDRNSAVTAWRAQHHRNSVSWHRTALNHDLVSSKNRVFSRSSG
jgi:hypothetical protein